MSRLKLPEYSIPHDLKKVLDNNLEVYPGMSAKSQTFLKILKDLKHVDQVDLSEGHYLQLSKLALYLEEYQSNADDMKKYTLLKKTIAKREGVNSEFQVEIDFDEEDKPSKKLHELVSVIDTVDKTSHVLQVANVTQTHIVLRDESAGFSKSYAAGKLYDIQFHVQKDHNYPRRCAHFALGLIHDRSSLTYLFPFKSKSFVKHDGIDNRYFTDLKTINPAINSNPEQKRAVLSIINKSSFPAPYVLYGPPGTGKTATLVEAMCQLYRDFPSSRVLVCTPSNTAADEITRRLLKFIQPRYIYRIYSQSKDGSKVEKDIQKCSNYAEGAVVYASCEDILKKRIIISTICNSMRFVLMRLPKDHFSHLIIDEAGHGIEPDILIPISLISGDGKLHGQIVLAGDPQQLGPTVNSKIAATILCRSILERLMSYDTYQKDSNNKYNQNYITKLLQNYRNHPDILHLPNKLFYDNELIPMTHRNSGSEKCPVIFHGVEGKEEKNDFSLSSYNHKEIQLVIKYVDHLLNDKSQISAKDIGIVTPFALQSKLMQRMLEEKNIKGINVGTVDLFQGQERKIMIMTTVRSRTFIHDGLEHIGFLSNSKRFNVAITRAKKLFIVVGNPNVLRKDDKWRMLMKFCKDNNSYQGLQLSMIELSDDGKVASKTLKIASSTELFGKELLELFILHEPEYDPDLWDYLDDYEDLIDVIEEWNMIDDIYDDYDEDNCIDFADDWDYDDDAYDIDEDFIDLEDVDFDDDFFDFSEPDEYDPCDHEEFYDDSPDFAAPDLYEETCDDTYDYEEFYDNVDETYDDYNEQLLLDALETVHIYDDCDYY